VVAISTTTNVTVVSSGIVDARTAYWTSTGPFVGYWLPMNSKMVNR